MCRFLIAPLLLDSFNFDPALKGSKWTDSDLEAFQYLMSMAAIDSQEYFQDLHHAISSVELNLKLGLRNLLIKDYKTYRMGVSTGVGLSSTFVPLDVMLKEFTPECIAKELEQLQKEGNLALSGIMCLSNEYED